MIDVNKAFKSFKYAGTGIVKLFRNENNARIHLLASIIVISLSFYLNIKAYEWLWILTSIFAVWITEAFNTALEKTVDLITKDFKPEAGEIKDLAAGAVLLAAIFSLLVGAIIFIPYLKWF